MDKELRILILEDAPADAALEEHELLNSGLVFTSKIADTRESFLKALEEFMPNLILSDYKLPSFDGLEALRLVQEKCPDVPFILVTGELGEEFAIEILKKGATDYVLKQKLSRLIPVVQRALQEVEKRDKQRHAEETLRESEQRYRSFVQNFKGIAFQGRMDWMPIFFHGSVEAITGYTAESFVRGEPRWDQIIHPQDLSLIFTEEEKKLHSTPDYSFVRQYRIVHKNGEVRWVEEFIQNVCDDSKKPIRVQGIIYDITERKQTEKALEESEKKYIDLFHYAPDGYHSLGPDGTILDVNDKWLEMFGYTRDKVIGKINLKDILTLKGREVFQTSFSELREKGTKDSIEQEIKRKDGTVVSVIINATAIYDENGNFVKSRSIVRDNSKSKAYEKLLVNAAEEWRITFDSMPYGVMLVDLGFNIQRANKYISNLCGISLKDIKGKNISELFMDKHLEESLKAHNKHIVSLGGYEYFDSKHKKYFIRYETPIPGENGLTKALVIALVDISELKDKEKRLIESRDAFLNMLKEIDFSYKELQDVHKDLILAFVNALDAKSPWTKGHSERVTSYAVSIAKELGLRDRDIDTLRTAALLHDIGKIGTYDVVLDKPGKLTKEEFEIVKKHPEHGEQILKPIKQFGHLLKVIRHHHERIDGKGYPDGIKDGEIPLLSKLITIADSYDSMTSDRPYRPALPREFALSELKNCSRTQFDPHVAEAFLRVLERSKYTT
ncbi:MAG: PAS domain S-box protein [Thermodesulfovibrionales bacterium]|nr:PAS domain S-box protein [Thermodesulfovibrionales bacterium]